MGLRSRRLVEPSSLVVQPVRKVSVSCDFNTGVCTLLKLKQIMPVKDTIGSASLQTALRAKGVIATGSRRSLGLFT